MTIKQQGGVFGRHPEFSTLSVADGAFSVSSTGAQVDGPLRVNSGANDLPLLVQSTDATAYMGFKDNTTTADMSVLMGASGDNLMALAKSRFRLYNNGQQSVQVETSGDFNVMRGNLVIGTSGKGIDFSATAGTGTSELFDDYEEGTWTPFLRGDSGGGTVSYTTQTGYYTKIGNVVTVTFEMVIDTVTVTPPGGSSGLGGLPFTSVHTMSDGPVEFSGMSGTFSTISIRPTSFAYIRGIAGAAQTSYAAVAPTQFLSGTAIRGKLTFITA